MKLQLAEQKLQDLQLKWQLYVQEQYQQQVIPQKNKFEADRDVAIKAVKAENNWGPNVVYKPPVIGPQGEVPSKFVLVKPDKPAATEKK